MHAHERVHSNDCDAECVGGAITMPEDEGDDDDDEVLPAEASSAWHLNTAMLSMHKQNNAMLASITSPRSACKQISEVVLRSCSVPCSVAVRGRRCLSWDVVTAASCCAVCVSKVSTAACPTHRQRLEHTATSIARDCARSSLTSRATSVT